MSISFKEKGKQVKLEKFGIDEVYNYLCKSLNNEELCFRKIASGAFFRPKTLLLQYKDCYFMCNSNSETWIELNCNKADKDKMLDVITAIKKWDKFSKTKTTFYVELEIGQSYIVVFENGLKSVEDYKLYFNGAEIKATEF